MSTTSPYLQLTLQDLDENPDSWGDVLNNGAIKLLEDAIAGTTDITLTAQTDYVLGDAAGGEAQARFAILNITGSPGGPTNIVAPSRSKIYLAANNCDATLTVKTSGGTGAEVPVGEARWVYCDGTNVIAASAGVATSALLATTATNALSLGGLLASSYSQLNVANTWTKGQVTQRVPVTNVGGVITLNPANSNSFYHLTTGGFNIAISGSPVNGAQMTLIVEQGAGAPHGGTFQSSTFIWEGGNVPTFSTAFGDVDYLGFEYVTLSGGNGRWIGNIIKGVA